MTTVLFAWELGGGLGHAAPLGDLARRMTAAEPDLRPVFCFRDPVTGRAGLRGEDWPVLAAPLHRGAPAAQSRAASYVQTLAQIGFGDRAELVSMLKCWDDVLALVGPELMVADHAPTAIAAARGRVPTLAIGTGFTLPPAHTPEFPALRRDRSPPTLHQRLLEVVNPVLASRGAASLRHLPELLQTEARAFLGLPHLDPYGPLRADRPLGPSDPRPAASPCPEDGPVFFYTRADEPKLAQIAEGLAASGLPLEGYILGGPTPASALLENAGARIHGTPPSFSEVVPRASLVLSHGGAGLTGAALIAGRPQVILPIHVESEINALRVADTGAGLAVAEVTSDAVAEALSIVAGTRLFREKAAEVAAVISRSWFPEDPLEEAAKIGLGLLTEGAAHPR